MTNTQEITPFELETQFKQMTLRELCFEAAQLAEIMENAPPDELMLQLRSWISEATQEKVDGYAWATAYLNLEIDEWKAKKAKLMEMCDAIITRKESELNAMKEGLLRLNSLGLIPDYLLGKTKAIEIRQNSRPKVTLNLPPSDRDFPEGKVRQNWTTFSSPGFGIANFSFLAGKTSYLLITKLGLLTIKMLVLPRLSNFVQFHWTPTRFRYQRTEWLADKDAILAAHEAGEDLSAIATVEIGYQVRFKNAPKRRRKTK
jgi:hypothetical protein